MKVLLGVQIKMGGQKKREVGLGNSPDESEVSSKKAVLQETKSAFLTHLVFCFCFVFVANIPYV